MHAASCRYIIRMAMLIRSPSQTALHHCIVGPPLPRATSAILDLLRAEGTASMQALLASRGIQHATALKHLMHLLDRGLIQEEALLKLHELHLGRCMYS